MSQEQKEQLAWITRIITLCLLGVASTVGMSVYNKVDEMYTYIKVHDEQIDRLRESDATQKEKMRDMMVELKELRQMDYHIQQQINAKPE